MRFIALLAGVILILATSASRASAAQPPNIVLILADDMGYSDVGCFGGEIETPHIDRIAAEGVRMTQFYNNARCCPTRAALLSGLYPHQAGVGHMMGNRGLPGYQGQLNDQCVTLAEVLSAAGYRTAMAGKWHVCRATVRKPMVNHASTQPFWQDKSAWPRQRGFQSYYGTIIGVNDFFDPFSLVRDNEPIYEPPPKDFYYTDAITDEAVKQIRASENNKKPFFLYVAHTAPHWPLHAREADIRKYEKVYADGWERLRETRLKRMIEMGIVDPSTTLPPREPESTAWADAPNKAWEARRMAVYAAQIDRMDQGIGKILAALDETKQADNTIVVFLSDNGGCAENVEPEWFDIPTKTRAGRAIHVGNDDPSVSPGGQESFLSYGPSWAMASNTPFRRYKHYVHEGGISTPMVMRWPGKLAAGSIDRAPRHVIDFMPTFAAAAEATYPADKPRLEGMNLLQRSRRIGRTLGWEHEGNRAVRRGDMKLVAEHGKAWELYDLSTDRTESKNLAAERPELVRELAAEYDGWAKRTNVLPWDEVIKRKSTSTTQAVAE
jgi:arylsulfatase A-like enzyme